VENCRTGSPESRNEFERDEATRLSPAASALPENQRTRVLDLSKIAPKSDTRAVATAPPAPVPVPMDEFSDANVRREKTQEFERPKELLGKDGVKRKGIGAAIPKKSFLVMVMLAFVAMEYMEDEEEEEKAAKPAVTMVSIRPELPATGTAKPNPEKSSKTYMKALGIYSRDTVMDYRNAARIFQIAIREDPHNVKALAFLASSYLNLIDSSNKDEKTFSVINKIIELSKDREVVILETVIAEVEFLAAQRRYDAAIQKLTEFSKAQGKFDSAIYYYLGWLFWLKGEYGTAMKQLNLIPPNGFAFASLYYLRGLLFEESQDYVQAEAEYIRALKASENHAKARLGLIRVSEKKGELKKQAPLVAFLYNNPNYQSPSEYVRTLIYTSKLALLEKKPKEAVGALEEALRLEPRNQELKLEYYTLLSLLGNDSRFKKLAQMYSLILDAGRKQRAGNLHEARTTLIEAMDLFPKSAIPLEKMGDLFFRSGEFGRAYDHYKKALDLDSTNGEIAIKLIDALIKNKETNEAEKVIAKYRAHPKLKSSVDRLAGDIDYDRGDFNAASIAYRKAMSRDSIDPEVYSSYANLMRDADQCRDAQFFYSLAQRLDPFNLNAIMGTARCILKTDGIDAAVGRVQEELARLPKARADLLAGIGELYFAAHDEAKALQFIEAAKEVDPEYPESFKIEGDIYFQQMYFKKDLKKKAMDAWKSYSDRKASDPYGYLKRFEMFLQDSNFDQASEELNKIFLISPRYPELHYRRAVMLRKMGRIKDALRELEQELKINPRFDPAWVEQGEAFLRDENVNEALKSFAKGMGLNPKNVQAKIGAGYANYLKRQYSSAIALLQAALALDKGNPDIHKKLGLTYRDAGDQVRARQAFQNYLDLAPDAPDRAEYEAYIKK
ncbi:MAG: hypothetical protein EBX52_04910, partial [Proteobacteria bacterium]|nr:hypothetical protein [Pseudomonadota bacterium]